MVSGDEPANILVKCSSNNRKRKRIRNESRTPTAAAERFMAIVPDDLLLEILIRLPNSRFVLRCSAVCKHWYALIHEDYNDFGQRFIQFHRCKQSSDFESSTIFNCANTLKGKGKRQVFYKLPRTKLKNRNLKPYDLSFMPPNLAIRASSRELLLLSSDVGQWYICNSLTREWLTLPKTLGILESFSLGFALVCHPQDNPENARYHYRVVMLTYSFFAFHPSRYVCHFDIFDSDSGLWTKKVVRQDYELPPGGKTSNFWRLLLQVVHTSNGIVHWLGGTMRIYFVAAFDPFTSELHLIPLPSTDFRRILPCNAKDRVRIGVEGGRFRLSLLKEISEVRFHLRIWELDGTDDSWTLVHDFFMNIGHGMTGSLLFVLSFDPHDGDVIFIVRGKKIVRYEISQNKGKKLCKFPYRWKSVDERKVVSANLKAFTLLHPLWPTPLPLLPAAHA